MSLSSSLSMNTGIGFTWTLPGRGFTIQTNVTPWSRTRAERRRRLAGIAVAQELPRCTQLHTVFRTRPGAARVVPAEVCFDARPCLEQRVLASLRSTISSHLWVTRRGQGKKRISPRQHRPRRRRKWSGRILIVQRGVSDVSSQRTYRAIQALRLAGEVNRDTAISNRGFLKTPAS